MGNVSRIIAMPFDQAVKEAPKHAADLWLAETLILSEQHGINIAVSLLPIGDDVLIADAPDQGSEQEYRLIQILRAVRGETYSTWRGLDVRHVARQARGNQEWKQFDVFAALEAGAKWLTQEVFDFLTLRDVPGAVLECYFPTTETQQGPVYVWDLDREQLGLFNAFRLQMVKEAEAQRHQVAAGVYVLNAPDLPAVKHEVLFDTIRMIVVPGGIFCSLIQDANYIPFWWQPETPCTAQVWLSPRGQVAVDAMLACIWRDACVVKEAFAHEQRGRKGYASPAGGNSNRPKHDSPVVFPRVVYKSQWGDDADRAQVAQAARKAHAVRASYVRLADGYQAHGADERAAADGYPSPPDGYTFRKAHTRGEGTISAPTARRVVCKGLQVASIFMG